MTLLESNNVIIRGENCVLPWIVKRKGESHQVSSKIDMAPRWISALAWRKYCLVSEVVPSSSILTIWDWGRTSDTLESEWEQNIVHLSFRLAEVELSFKWAPSTLNNNAGKWLNLLFRFSVFQKSCIGFWWIEWNHIFQRWWFSSLYIVACLSVSFTTWLWFLLKIKVVHFLWYFSPLDENSKSR